MIRSMPYQMLCQQAVGGFLPQALDEFLTEFEAF